MGALSMITDITALKKTEENLRVASWAVESSINGIGLTDARGLLTYLNPSALKMWGYDDVADLLGRPALFLWDSEGLARDYYRNFLRDGSWFGEIKAKRRDGTTFDGQLSMTLIRDRKGRPVGSMGSCIDISRQKAAQRELRNKEHELQIKARKLEDSNTTLKVLLEHRDFEKSEQARNLMATLDKLVFPYLDRLRPACTRVEQSDASGNRDFQSEKHHRAVRPTAYFPGLPSDADGS